MSMQLSKSGTDLSLTGMRIGPRDPTTHAPKVGVKQEIVRPENSQATFQARIMKERSGFSGGFKIPDEFRKSKIKKKGLFSDTEQEEEVEGPGQSHITKDEILQQLNLGTSDSGIGVGKHGTNSKAALAKDLIDGIDKDLDKLKRQRENILLRKHLAMTGQSLVEQTEEEKLRDMEAKLKRDLTDGGVHVIAASPRKIQVMRHQASQLGSIKNLDLEEIEDLKAQNEKRLRELEDIYMRKMENSTVGKTIRERMGFAQNDQKDSDSAKGAKNDDFERADDSFLGGQGPNSKKRKKSVKIADEKENQEDNFQSFGAPKNRQSIDGKSRGSSAKPPTSILAKKSSPSSKTRPSPLNSRSASRGRKSKRQEESPVYDSPRQKLYEAKFEKYLANKEQKVKHDKKLEKLKKDDFEIYMRGPGSPSKSARRFSSKDKSGKYEPDSLIPSNYDQELIKRQEEENKQKLMESGQLNNSKDPFKRLGVSNEDKMTFFLLKWIFNAIKRDSQIEDTKLNGKPYITKIDLVKQLSKNDELMNALGYEGPEEVVQGVKQTVTVKDGSMLWEEFLDFFFLRQSQSNRRGNDPDSWWRKIGHSESKEQKPIDQGDKMAPKDSPVKKQTIPRYGAANEKQSQLPYNYEDPDKKPVKMTENLKILQDTRRGKVIQEVEDEFKAIHQQKMAQKSLAAQTNPTGTKKKVGWGEGLENEEEELLQEQFGIKREKSECKLLQSQIAIMQEIFESIDKYNDGILRRGQFIMALRTDERVVEFIDVDAVKVPYSHRILTLDEVFIEIEKDEMFETANLGKQATQINHKEFLTWREFMTYFNDYREIEDRNKKAKEIQKTRQQLQKERNTGKDGEASEDESDQITSLMEKEKQRRLQELPKMRPADQIDISEKQLQLLRDLYDQLNKVPGKEAVYMIDFFIQTRKNPQLRSISTAIARDPEGYSRIPRETFQQVFDRMENEIQSKELEWSTLVEYFTKRGRPLTKEELNKLIEDDRKQREDEESKRRNEEEAERRRMARLMEDLDEDQDFETFELQQKGALDNKPSSNGNENFFNMNDGQPKNSKKKLNFDGVDSQDEDELNEDDDYDDEIERDQDYHSEDEDGDNGYSSDPELGTAKRTYKFNKDQDGASPSTKRQRAQSAKSRNRGQSVGRSYNEGDLRNTKLTTRDYVDHEKSLNKKKGKYGVTVPKPFAFDLREKTRKKTIREQKVDEMVAEKRLKEENIIKHQFRSNPIPPEVLIPRYKTIIEANEMRRLEAKKNSVAILKAKEKPFSFYERDKLKQNLDPEEYLPYDLRKPQFKANPIPRACSVLIFDQMMKQQEQERQERIRKQAEANFSKAKLPERMQMHSEKLKQMPLKRVDSVDQHSFKPKINELVTREQFKKQQDKFNEKLNKKKAQQQVTRPLSPKFTKTAQKPLEREYLNEKDAPIDKFKAALMKKVYGGGGGSTVVGNSQAEDKAAQNPSSTKSMALSMQKRREDLEEKRKKDELKAKADQERFDKQNRMKTTVQTALKERIKDDTEKRQKDMEERRAKAREEENRNKAAIQESIDRARQRPLLVESVHSKKHNENLAKIRATKAFVDILQSQGLNPREHLDDEQKELLAEADYIEKHKKEFNRSNTGSKA